ncbi:MAG: hypothetical protein H6Q89_4132, partial [Myxococcaceae bacterium]|nr:hypothetical protein [Myxococcaceae bacterium]
MTPTVLPRILCLAVAALCAGCTPTCEEAVARKNHPLAATQCEKAFLADHTPAHALATVQALSQLKRAAEVKTRLPWLKGTPYEPATHYFLALAARAGGDDAAAQAEFERCVAGTPAAGLHDLAARCARQLASLHWIQGRFEDAFATLAIALTEVRHSEDPILEGMVYGQLADLLAEVGDEAGSGRALEAVADRFSPVFPAGYAQVRLRQGLLELNRGHPNIARDCFEEALGLSVDAGLRPVVRDAHVSLAILARSVQDFDGGERHLAAAAAIPAQ